MYYFWLDARDEKHFSITLILYYFLMIPKQVSRIGIKMEETLPFGKFCTPFTS
jgi:hypothetical protein